MGWRAVLLFSLLAAPAAAGPIRVEIRAEPEPSAPFVVSVIGHYADFHLGHSRHWKDVVLRAGRRQFIPLGPVNPLINMGVSVSVQHPRYVTERARSDRTPLLLRPVGFETFRPRTWRSVLDTGGRIDNGGPDYLLGQILGHFQLFLGTWLPAVDAADAELVADDASLRSFLPLFEELAGFAMTDAALVRPPRSVGRAMQQSPVYQRSLAEQALKQRQEVRELLYRIGEWLSVVRADRVAVRDLMAAMRYSRQVGEELMGPDDRARVGDLLERYAADRAARREPEALASWTNPHTRVAFRVRVEEPPRACARVGITADLTGVVSADLGDMTRRVAVRFCRRGSGEWGIETS